MNSLIKQIVESKFNFNINIEDNEQKKSLSKYTFDIKSQKNAYEYQYLVDLGLPSKTLWHKYNLGVNHRKLKYQTNWKGNYYAWGELEPNDKTVSWKYYKFSNGDTKYFLTKYCTDSTYGMQGFNDELEQLLPEDDIVTIIMGEHYHIPTKEQFEELKECTISKYIKCYQNVDKLEGWLFKSTLNENEIFFPIPNGYKNTYVSAYYWTSNIKINEPFKAWIYAVSKNQGYPNIVSFNRNATLLIRPVFNYNSYE